MVSETDDIGLHELLRSVREDAGMSGRVVAEMIGVSWSTFHRMENGDINGSVKNMLAWMSVLGMNDILGVSLLSRRELKSRGRLARLAFDDLVKASTPMRTARRARWVGDVDMDRVA